MGCLAGCGAAGTRQQFDSCRSLVRGELRTAAAEFIRSQSLSTACRRVWESGQYGTSLPSHAQNFAYPLKLNFSLNWHSLCLPPSAALLTLVSFPAPDFETSLPQPVLGNRAPVSPFKHPPLAVNWPVLRAARLARARPLPQIRLTSRRVATSAAPVRAWPAF
jgi:hypothetical protein